VSVTIDTVSQASPELARICLKALSKTASDRYSTARDMRGLTAALPAFGRISVAVGSKQTAYTIFSFSLLLASLSCILAYRFAAREKAARPEQT